jgi:hypothetical protein
VFLELVHDWLAPSDSVQPADLTFVLAGRDCRKSFGLKMLQQAIAPTLLLSVGRFEIRRFAELDFPVPVDLMAAVAQIEPRQRHLFILLEGSNAEVQVIPVGRLGTWMEIVALSQWLQSHKPIKVVNIVTSGFHLKRVRWCCRALLPSSVELRFIAVPFESPGCNRKEWWFNALSRKFVLMEVAKVGLYMPLLLLRKVLRRCATEAGL